VVFVVAFLTKKFYGYMMGRGLEHNVAVHYDRKVIHMLSGGLVAVTVPFVFKTPFSR